MKEEASLKDLVIAGGITVPPAPATRIMSPFISAPNTTKRLLGLEAEIESTIKRAKEEIEITYQEVREVDAKADEIKKVIESLRGKLLAAEEDLKSLNLDRTANLEKLKRIEYFVKSWQQC